MLERRESCRKDIGEAVERVRGFPLPRVSERERKGETLWRDEILEKL